MQGGAFVFMAGTKFIQAEALGGVEKSVALSDWSWPHQVTCGGDLGAPGCSAFFKPPGFENKYNVQTAHPRSYHCCRVCSLTLTAA